MVMCQVSRQVLRVRYTARRNAIHPCRCGPKFSDDNGGFGGVPIASAHANFMVTPSVRRNLKNVARIVSGSSNPVLLEGPTSAGKTSLVTFLGEMLGYEVVRINNHEHTDLQVGQYSFWMLVCLFGCPVVRRRRSFMFYHVVGRDKCSIMLA